MCIWKPLWPGWLTRSRSQLTLSAPAPILLTMSLLTRIADSLFYVFLTDEIIVNMASLYLRCIFWFIIYFLEINAINRTYKQLWKDMIFPNVFKSSIYKDVLKEDRKLATKSAVNTILMLNSVLLGCGNQRWPTDWVIETREN